MKNTKKIEFKPLTPIDGNRAEAVNVRRRGDWMEVTGTPAAVCPKTTDDRFLGADRRGSRTYYFMQRNGKDVIMSGYSQDGTFTAVQRTLFADGGSVTGFAVSGEFVVMSTSAGLRYLHFNGSGYDSLGGMVEMPEFAFGTIMSATISTDIAGITLSATMWQPTLHLVSSGLGHWQPFVKAVEIYATEEAGDFSTMRFRCEQSQTGQKTYHLRMRAENDTSAQLRQSAEAQEMRLVASITDTKALQEGTVAGSNLTDIGGGKVAVAVIRQSPSTEWQPTPSRFTANTLDTVGTSLFAGNLVRHLPTAPHFLSVVDATTLKNGVASTYVSVDIATEAGNATITRSALLEQYSLQTTNLVSYPDSRARRLTLIVVAGGQRYSRTIPLTPSATGNYAYATRPGGFAIQPDTSSSVPPTTARSVAQPTTLLHSTSNPLQWTECTRADNAGVHGVMPTLRYGATWIIGRSPVCLLSADGIRLLSFDTSGRCTASTRISQRIVASSRLAAVTENGLAFIDSNGQLCRYEGTRVTSTGVTVPSAEGLVYSASHGELLVYGGGKTMAVAPDNTFTHRTSRYQSHASGLLSDSDNVYDPDIEEKSTQAVDLRTDQTELPFRLRLAQWHIDASDADVRLTVYAENGYSCHGEMVSSQRLRGAVRAVVRQRVAMPRSRTVRFGLQGTLPSGTRICNINMS
uniref:hypothetical protein n=1 Tax=Candidatus Limisoma sp. TaxID=3076476 RepID=UPI0040277B66